LVTVDVIFPPRGKANGSLLVVFCTKRETYFLGLGDSGRGKLQCVPFITLKRIILSDKNNKKYYQTKKNRKICLTKKILSDKKNKKYV